MSEEKELTEYLRFFLEPRNSTHRQYEALRAYFVDGLSSSDAAELFGYTPGSFRVLCHEFRQNLDRKFFLPPKKAPRSAPNKDAVRDRVIALRKHNLSIYDISEELAHAGTKLSPAAISGLSKQEGCARLPRRRDEERPARPAPEQAAVADVRKLDLKVVTSYKFPCFLAIM